MLIRSIIQFGIRGWNYKMVGLPYMGSKRKLSKKIVNFILEKNPDCKYVFDLFGGGGAISFEFLKYEQINIDKYGYSCYNYN
jgi:site-specific DNA-adenine methylase